MKTVLKSVVQHSTVQYGGPLISRSFIPLWGIQQLNFLNDCQEPTLAARWCKFPTYSNPQLLSLSNIHQQKH